VQVKRALLLFVVACGGIPQSKECEKYLACSEAVEPMSTMQSRLTYGPGGTCWMNAGDAEGCTGVCKLAVQALQLGAGMSTPECM
jgi:hypothetical protein